MADDLRKLKDDAAIAVEKGKHKRAAELYDKVARRDPDPQWAHRAGEAHRRAGDRALALERFRGAAEGYARHGFLLKAIAVCKLILEMDPQHGETQERLAALYARDGGTVPISTVTAPEPSAIPAADEDARATPVEVAAVAARTPIPPGALPPPPRAEATDTARAASHAPSLPGARRYAGTPVAPPLAIDLSPRLEIAELGPLPEEFAPPPLPPPERAVAAPPPPPTHAAPRSAPERQALARIHAGGGALDAIELATVMPAARTSQQFAAVEVPIDDDIPIHSAPSALPQIPLFSSLDKARLRHLIERVSRVEAGPGQVLVRQGEVGDALYVVVRGSVRVSVEVAGVTHDLGRLDEGAFFGELALLTRSRRMATVTAATDTELLAISGAVVSELVEDSPAVLATLLRFFRDRLVGRLVATSPLFQAFPGAEGAALAERFQLLEFEPGAHLLQQGAFAPGLYVLLCGGCDVVRRVPGGEEPLAVVGPGELVGEMSLLEQVPSMATVRARTRLWALGMPRATFQEVIMTHPQVLIYVSELAERRRARSRLV